MWCRPVSRISRTFASAALMHGNVVAGRQEPFAYGSPPEREDFFFVNG